MTITCTGVGVDVDVLSADSRPTRKTLLDDITVTLEERRVVVIGANGSGKSTFLRLLNGLIQPTRGRVVIDGRDTLTQVRDVRRHVGFVFTDPLSQLVMPTPLEDVELSLRRTVPHRKERQGAAQRLLDARGLGHLARQSIYDLSGGERQMVALTSVLAVQPGVIVADEPTTLLDLRNKANLRRVFAELDQQLVFSTHDLEVAADADRALVIEAGHLVFDGTPTAAIDHYRRSLGL